MTDEYCQDWNNKWNELYKRAYEVVDQIVPRGQINGVFWVQIIDKVLMRDVFCGNYDSRTGRVYVQWIEKLKQIQSLIEGFRKVGRADQIQDIEPEYFKYSEELEKLLTLTRHSDMFKEDVLGEKISKQIGCQLQDAVFQNPNLSSLMDHKQSRGMRGSFHDTQEANQQSINPKKSIEDILQMFYQNQIKQKQNKRYTQQKQTSVTRSTANNISQSADKFSMTFQNPNSSTILNTSRSTYSKNTVIPWKFALDSRHGKSQITDENIKSSKKLIYDVQDISNDIDQNQVMLRLCQQVALKDEEKGLNIDAFDLLDQAQKYNEDIKALKRKKHAMINIIQDKRKSTDQAKRQMTPLGTRGMSYIKNVL
ncbi:UNKNOWN [Stylonychia lemnae]|uniref:Uncharacterized protein n=1 Tax=Stylonychia lemnae TaxID=5949 RepID=A0A078AWD4_STYLE|nr:UNKNOWN [Stylonychia lemnae]|eukprot:CDW85552.1 UNKNOWN [Stylonychia lemnae]